MVAESINPDLKKTSEKNIGKLRAYKRKYGDFNVPINWKEDKPFAQWVDNIRRYPTKLPLALKRQLRKIKFEFTVSRTWNGMFHQLELFYQRFGHSYVPPLQWEYEQLFDWTVAQRHSKSLLAKSQLDKLNSLNFEWEALNSNDQQWELHYSELIEFKRLHGHTRVPEGFKESKALANWVAKQRAAKTKGKLSRFQRSKLNAIKFLWTEDLIKLREEAWNARYQELAAYKKQYGHIDRLTVTRDNYSLGLWMTTQIVHQDKISDTRRKKLNKLGFRWDKGNPYEERWNEMFGKLVAFKNKHGHCRVTRRNDFKLSVWLSRQKRDHALLEKKKNKKLRDLGVTWPNELFDEIWNTRFSQLKQFKKEHKHLRVRTMPQLFEWISTQKKFDSEGTLQKARKDKLDTLGLPWIGEIEQQKMAEWNVMYDAFQKLKSKYPSTYHIKLRNDPKLLHWVKRQIHSKDKLSLIKKKKLNAIGFLWKGKNYHDQLWDEMYKRIIVYKAEHGNCDVPQQYSDKKLVYWVNGQRTKELPKKHRELLNKIGFSWRNEIKNRQWFDRLDQFINLKKSGQLETIVAHTPLHSWLYQQRKKFDYLPNDRKKLLVKAGIV